MAKRKINFEWTQEDESKLLRRLNWERNVSEMREGRRIRATTFADQRKKANREACRKNRRGEWA
jgi:hypothetical protein